MPGTVLYVHGDLVSGPQHLHADLGAGMTTGVVQHVPDGPRKLWRGTGHVGIAGGAGKS